MLNIDLLEKQFRALKNSIFGKKGLLRNRLFHAANFMFIMQIFALGMSFVNRIMLARILGEEGLGTYQYAISWMEVLMILTVFGLDRLLVREIAIAEADNRPDIIHGLLRFGNLLSLTISVIVMVVTICIIMTIKDGTSFSEMTIVTLLISPILLPLRTNIRVRQAAMQGLNKMVRSQIPEFIIQPVLFVGLIASTWWILRGDFTPDLALIVYILSILITVIIGIRFLIDVIPNNVPQVKPAYHIRDWLIDSLPLIILSGMGIINSRLDILMLGAIDSLESVGIYLTAIQIPNTLSLVLVVANTILAPSFARLYKQGEMKRLQALVTKSTRLVLLASMAMAFILFIAGIPLLQLFGDGFVKGSTVLNLVILGQLVNVFFSSSGYLLMMTSHAWYSTIGIGFGAISNVVLNLFLIPHYGMDGAAVATLITYIIWNVLLAVFLWRKLGIIATPIGRFWE